MFKIHHLRYFYCFPKKKLKNILGFPSQCHIRNSCSIPFKMKLDSPEFKSILTDEVRILEKLFIENGYEIRVAGGAVRDLLLGMKPKDLDFASDATPDEMKTMFDTNNIRMINMSGEKHGTITARINEKDNFEVTTLRVDTVTDGRRAEVQFVKDWQLDANRRDLTINSMFLGLDGVVYDYFNGYDDLMNRRVLFVGDAATRIQEDYLRILRYFRFYGRICLNNNNHDKAVLAALEKHRDGLDIISGERVWSELHKIAEGNLGPELLKLIINLKIGSHLGLPEDCDFNEYDSLVKRLYKDKTHKVRAVTIICGLFSNIEQFISFFKRCKLSNVDRDLGLFLMEHRDNCHDSIKPYQALVCSSKKPLETRQHVEQTLLYRGADSLLEEFSQWETPKFPVNGHMIRERLPNVDGRQMGYLLQKLKDLWVEENFSISSDDLLSKLSSIRQDFRQSKKCKVDNN